jgi:hypothetical protein
MVWIKFRADVGEARITAHLQALRALAEIVPGVQQLNLGRNFTERANGYTHGLSVILTDKAALQGYAVHRRRCARTPRSWRSTTSSE